MKYFYSNLNFTYLNKMTQRINSQERLIDTNDHNYSPKRKNNIIILDVQKKSFKFHDLLLASDKWTEVHITVTHKKYSDNKEYYDITYKYTYSPNNIFGYEGHPFMGTDFVENQEGDIVAVNDMTTMMIKYLLMDYELMNNTGHTTPQDYKRSIMHSLSLFWD